MIVFVTQGDGDWLAQSVAEHPRTAAAAAVPQLSAAQVASPAHPSRPPCTGQVPEQIANTWQNIGAPGHRSCYLSCMISPDQGNLPGFRVQAPLGHGKPHDVLFPGMLAWPPRARASTRPPGRWACTDHPDLHTPADGVRQRPAAPSRLGAPARAVHRRSGPASARLSPALCLVRFRASSGPRHGPSAASYS